ncbi:MAG: DUF4375 domain-containing protein [Verrucomicrobiaceae bacterium]|nr:DUF4375 domain-containing protein [Verrucomicrobiaceae bacterium]
MNDSHEQPKVLPLLRLTIDEARALEYFVLCDIAWEAVTSACAESRFVPEDPDARAEDVFIDLLPSHWSTVYAVHEMEYDVLAGGFINFFENHGDGLVAAAAKGLADIGASKHRSILLEAADHFDDEDEVIGPFGSAYYAACRSDGDPREMLASYILANFDLFTVSR